MCQSGSGGHCLGCHHAVSRRRFLGRSAAAACGAGLLGQSAAAKETTTKRPIRVAVVFLGHEKPSWPYPEFDIDGRENEILGLLRNGCPGVDFQPVSVRSREEINKAAAMADEVDGYLVYVVTLCWQLGSAIPAIGKLGKPLVVADEYLGGSGVFLTRYAALLRGGIPAVGVASTREADLATVARCFADLKPEESPQAFADRAMRAYRKAFATAGPMQCLDDPMKLTDTAECLKRFRDAHFLIVGRGKPGEQRDFLGAKATYVGFDEFRTLYDATDPDEAAEWADRWSKEAERVVEPTAEWIRNAGRVYLATKALLKKYGTDTVTMNCLGGFNSGQLPAYPCLGFRELLNDGGQGVCEAMPDDTLSMLLGRILTGRPGYVSDPVLDTAKNQIVYAHCMATTRVFGPEGEPNPYRVRSLHSHDPRSTCVQSFLPEGYMTTSLRTSAARKQLVIHRAKAVGNLDSGRGCRTQLVGEVHGDIEKLFHQWDAFNWHRVTVYGDIQEPMAELGKALGLEVIVEA